MGIDDHESSPVEFPEFKAEDDPQLFNEIDIALSDLKTEFDIVQKVIPVLIQAINRQVQLPNYDGNNLLGLIKSVAQYLDRKYPKLSQTLIGGTAHYLSEAVMQDLARQLFNRETAWTVEMGRRDRKDAIDASLNN